MSNNATWLWLQMRHYECHVVQCLYFPHYKVTILYVGVFYNILGKKYEFEGGRSEKVGCCNDVTFEVMDSCQNIQKINR